MIYLTSIFALLAISSTSVFDEMLRLIGIAAIIHAFFKGIKSLTAQPVSSTLPTSPATSAPSVIQLPVQAAAIQAVPVTAASAQDITPEIVAIIAAAVAAFTDSTHRVVSIKYQSNTWEKVGRQSVLTSHRIR
jgi:hypothetical protein